MNRDIKDIYWLAGILEGEGSFSVLFHKKTGRPFRFVISVGSTDKEVIMKISTILRGYVRINNIESRVTKGIGSKTIYKTNVTGNLAIQWIMTLYSFMCSRRKIRMLEIINVWKNSKNCFPYINTNFGDNVKLPIINQKVLCFQAL